MFKLVTGIFQLLTHIFQLLTGIFKLTNWYIQVSKIKKVWQSRASVLFHVRKLDELPMILLDISLNLKSDT